MHFNESTIDWETHPKQKNMFEVIQKEWKIKEDCFRHAREIVFLNFDIGEMFTTFTGTLQTCPSHLVKWFVFLEIESAIQLMYIKLRLCKIACNHIHLRKKLLFHFWNLPRPYPFPKFLLFFFGPVSKWYHQMSEH